VPGTHGIVFPWSPPLFGIPVEILQQLEKKLVEKLVEVTEKWIPDQALRNISPASQSSGYQRIFTGVNEFVQSVTQ
jgi:hypothetical protein